MVKTNIQTFTGEVEILSNLHVGPSGSSYLTANGAASNVLDITGNVGATFFVGDGGFLSNIATTLSDIVNQGNVSANVLQFNSTSDYAGVGLVTSSNVGIQNTAPSHTLSIGDKIRVDDNTVETSGQSVIQVDGRILATRFQGDGGLLSNIATTFESIVNQGNVASNVVKFSSDSAYAGAGVITDSNVGIQNTAPTHNLSVGSNLHVNDTGSNVLTVHGNVVASNLNLGVFSITPAYGLNDVCNTSNGTSNVVQFQNATTSLVATSNITVGGNVTAQQLISTSNTEVGDRLKFSGSNVFVDTLRVADVAANLVTYDQATGELTDSGGSFMNKFTMVSEQPPSNIFSNVSTGPYTLTTSNLATNSNTFNAFDGTANAWVSGDLAGGYIGGSNVFHETNLTQLSNTHPTQFGDWLAVEFPYKSRLRHMKLTPLTAAQFPDSANIYATNDSVTWTEIGYWKDRNPVTNSNVQTISVNTSEDFNKYALVATKAAGNSSNVAIQDWNLFTESISVDGGKGVDKRRAATKTFVFTVSNASGANKYYINGVQQSSLQLEQNHTYIFDVSSTTLAGHPLRFSTTATGSEYSTGITNSGTYGGGGTATRTFAVTTDTPTTLYYFCTAHAGMGATMSISPTAELEVSGRIMSRDLVVTGTGGMSIGGGTTAQRAEYPALGTIRYNSTTGFMESYTASGWGSIAQPPTVTGISPLTTLVSGGSTVGAGTETKIVPPTSDATAERYFGYSVAMNSAGTRVIVGVGYASSVAAGECAYIYNYDGSNWDTGTKIVAPAADQNSYDNFGISVAMSGDGTKVIVGAYREDSGGLNRAGAAYIYTYDSSSSSWGTGVKIQASDKETSDYFGWSVAMNSDGTRIIVGAYAEDAADEVGQAGDLVDAGSAYIYTYDSSSSSWDTGTKIVAPDRETLDEFGWSVAMNSAGTRVIVGARYEDFGSRPTNAGAAYIYTYDSSSSSWDTGTKIVASDPENSDHFGGAVAMNSDGTRVIVGAPNEDPGGITNAGSVYIYAYDGSSWAQEAKIVASDPESSDYLGNRVAMNSDGTRIIAGANGEDFGGDTNAGSAYIFTYDGSNWVQHAKIGASDSASSDNFGYSVAMSGDGAKVIAGAPNEDPGGISNTGSAYIYEITDTATTGFVFDTSTQVFTVTGTGIVSGSTVQLEGVDGSLYSVVDASAPNAAGTQVTFKMGGEAVEFPPNALTNNDSITGYTASASMNSTNAYKAFDDVVTTGSYWHSANGNATVGYDSNAPYLAGLDSAATQDISGTTHRGHWIQLQIPNPVILSRAVIGSAQSNFQHGQFVILGSNDGTNWTVLHAGTGTTLSTNVTTLSAGSTEAFSYFRVVIKSKNTGSTDYDIGLNNVQFFGGSGSWVLAQQPYKVRINSTSGLSGASTATIGFPAEWTTAAGANLGFDTGTSQTQTLVGTDGSGGTNMTFSVAPGSNALPSGLTLTGSTGAITGQIAAAGTTSVTFRLTDNGSGLFTDRAINITGVSDLYAFSSHTFTNAGVTGSDGPTLSQLTTAYSPAWTDYTSNLNVVVQGIQLWTVPKSGTYRITAKGAPGGYSTLGPDTYGYGAETRGDFTLSRGDKLKIIVGQRGEGNANGNSDTVAANTSAGGAGGGASWVFAEAVTHNDPLSLTYTTDANLYLVAGGGGGGQRNNTFGSGYSRADAHGGSSQSTVQTSWTASLTGSYGSGGGASYGINGGSAGGPVSTLSGGVVPNNPNEGGYSPAFSPPCIGGIGGYQAAASPSYNCRGGFGGGGGNGAHAGGGGGGYVGGRGSPSFDNMSGYGGSSRNNGSNTTFTTHTGGVGSVYIQAPGTF